MFYFDVPYHIDLRGRTAGTDYLRHVLNLIELLLLTRPGERVNRPSFGGGAMALVFECNSDQRAALLQVNLRSAVAELLSTRIDLRRLDVSTDDEILRIDLDYVVRGEEQNPQVRQLERPLMTETA
jgi:uncharacterized protein